MDSYSREGTLGASKGRSKEGPLGAPKGGFDPSIGARWRKQNVPEKEYIDKMKILRVIGSRDPQGTQLKATKIDFCVEENSKAHHTDEYEIKNLIVRRGQVFKMIVTFNRPVNEGEDKIILQLATGPNPKQSKKSIIRMENTNSLSTSSWGMQIVKQRGATVEMSVMSPADAFVGEYTVYLETKTKGFGGQDESNRQQDDKKIYVLFNAWCKDDRVFMESEDHRKEYVLNDHGVLWRGSKYHKKGLRWNLGQFETVSLKTCLKLLDKAEVKTEARGNPVRICRVISKMVNSDDDEGVLVGNWSGDYKNGTPPNVWKGSIAILDEYSKNGQPVKYGQCWVFSGLVTTLLRAIGIPTRSVTNFESGRDTDKSLTIDRHIDEDGNPISAMNSDFVWNFHVWNESFFTRPDLPSGHDGWQAHDATPQETSERVFQCGPCPLTAIKKGEVYLPYDTGFVFAEVNGDRITWEVNAEGEMSVLVIDKYSIGKFISTKAVDSDEREDLTSMYKFPDGSEEERKAVRLANHFSSRKDEDIYPPETSHDVEFKVISQEVMIGDNFDIKLAIKNTSSEPRTVDVAIVTKVSFYTGADADDLKKKKKEPITIGGKEEMTAILPILLEDYITKMSPDDLIRIYFKAKVKETGQVFFEDDVVDFEKPELEADISDQVNMYKCFRPTFSFTNPLPVKLTNCKLNLESYGMLPKSVFTEFVRDIEPHAKVSIPVYIEYKKYGRRYLEAVFHSDQLSGIQGEFAIFVQT